MKVMGLDIGDVRIGVAISDAIEMFASPYTVIDRKKEKAVVKIAEIIKENNIGKVVAGLPKSLNGEEKVQAEKVREFVKKLESVLKIEIIFVDERFSTVAADRMLSEATKKGAKDKRKVVDKVAATYILRTYLDRKK